MGLKSFMPLFTGEIKRYNLYAFTPNEAHDPEQSKLSLPRVLFALDDFPVNPGQSMLIVRDSGAQQWDGLSDDIVATLAKVTKRLRQHMKSVLVDAKSVTILNSETSIPEPHTLFVPVHDRKDPQRLWDRTYDDATRAPKDQLVAMQARLALPAALKQELDVLLADVNWGV